MGFLIDLKKIRNAWTGAHCSGEKDVFGNIYKIGEEIPLPKKSFKIRLLRPVGNYAIKIIWEDGHSNGIYTFDLVKKLSYEKKYRGLHLSNHNWAAFSTRQSRSD